MAVTFRPDLVQTLEESAGRVSVKGAAEDPCWAAGAGDWAKATCDGSATKATRKRLSRRSGKVPTAEVRVGGRLLSRWLSQPVRTTAVFLSSCKFRKRPLVRSFVGGSGTNLAAL
jgi:hypothetical protein